MSDTATMTLTEREAWDLIADGKAHHLTKNGAAMWIDDQRVLPIANRLPSCRPAPFGVEGPQWVRFAHI